MRNVLETTRLNKIYTMGKGNSAHILKDINCTINKGEFVSVMGASGSGKSTLLYNISGMDRMTSGSVAVEEMELSTMTQQDLAKLRLNFMGFVFQQNHLLKNLCILNNIMLPAVLAKKISRKEIKQKALALMKRTGVEHLAYRDITMASGGELQRVSICRALMNDPEILFGDEPTGALNSRSSDEIMDLMARINQSGTTILMVTHDSKVAAKTERLLFMVDGSIVSEKYLGKYVPERDDVRQRETELSIWLKELGF
jgi:putative ABC transport system ATP-binding protein